MPNNEWHDINSPGWSPWGKKKFKTEEELFMEEMNEDSISEEVVAWEQQQGTARSADSQSGSFRIHSLSWRHTEESREGAQKAREGDTIRLLCGVDGCADGTNVTFELSWKTQSSNPYAPEGTP